MYSQFFYTPVEIGKMLYGKFYHRIILRMHHFIHKAAECIWIFRHRINRVIQKTFHHNDGSVSYFIGPVCSMIDKRTKNLLCAEYLFYIAVWFSKEFSQP